MKNLFFLFTIIIFALTSCEKSKNNQDAEKTIAPNVFAIDSVKLADSITVNKKLSLAFHAQVLVFPSIKNKTLMDSIYSVVDISLPEYAAENLRNALNVQKEKFYTETKLSLNDFSPDFKQNWEQHSYMKLFSTLNDFMIIQYTDDGYTGGAHGYYNEMYKVFDTKKNQTLQVKNIIKNPENKIWAKILLANYLKTEVANGNAELLLVDEIPLNNNFYFDKENLYFLYNQYEIAPYAAGPVIIKIPFIEIKSFLTPEFRTELGI